MCSCTESRNNLSDFPELEAILPANYLYTVCEWSKLYENEQSYSDGTFRINIATKDEALVWIDKFQAMSNLVFNKDRTFAEDTLRYVYKVYLKCIHNTRPRSTIKKPHKKHTNCRAKLLVTVKRTRFSKENYKSKSTDVHLPSFPMIVTYRNKHNHNLNTAETIKYHPLNLDVKNTFLSYFEKGLTPAKAIKEYESCLKEIYGDDCYKAQADGSLYPNKKMVYRLYYTAFKTKYGESSGEQMLEDLQSHIKKYNDEMKGRFSELKKMVDGNFIVVIVTPLMQRILDTLPETGEVLFSESIGNVDTYGSKLYILLTNSCCGGLPVGCIITTSGCEEILSSAFELYKSFLNAKSFNGQGMKGPKIIMTGDSISERNSFHKAFPSANLLLCIFHVLQAIWQYVMNSGNDIANENKQELFFKLKSLVYSNSVKEFNSLYRNLQKDATINKYDNFKNYIEKLYLRRKKWAKCFRRGLITGSRDTDNISEAAIRVVKDNILNRKKVYSTVQLFSYITKDVESFYRDKIISVSNERPPSYLKSSEKKSDDFLITPLGEDNYIIKNTKKNTEYYVDTNIGLCSCPNGENGAICEHQISISKKFKTTKFMSLFTDATQTSLLFIATGQKTILNDLDSPLLCITKNDDDEISAYMDIETVMSDASTNETKTNFENNIKSEIGIDNDEEIRTKAIKDFVNFSQMIAEKAKNNDETFSALKRFLENSKELITENSLNSALHSFGRFNGVF